jgi:hypothetical protein
MTADGFFGKDQLSVDRNFEYPAGGLNQAHFGTRKDLLQLSRQTGSSGLVVSNNAVLNGHIHCNDTLA